MTDVIQVVTTTADEEDAQRIADALIEQRLAACVQVSGPIHSRYRWQGQIESSREWLCTVKTTLALYDRVEAAIRAIHSYDEPEILALPIIAGSDGYLAWLRVQVADRPRVDDPKAE